MTTVGNLIPQQPPSKPQAMTTKSVVLWQPGHSQTPLRIKPPCLTEFEPITERIHPAARIAKLLLAGQYPLYFYGSVGTGKSMAAAAVYQYWPAEEHEMCVHHKAWLIKNHLPMPDRQTDPMAKVVSEFLHQIAWSDDKKAIWKRIEKTDLLILDDVGRRELTPEQAEILIRILELRGSKPSIYTGNHSPDQLRAALKDDRIASRILRGMNTVEFTGPDRRLGGNK